MCFIWAPDLLRYTGVRPQLLLASNLCQLNGCPHPLGILNGVSAAQRLLVNSDIIINTLGQPPGSQMCRVPEEQNTLAQVLR